MARGFSSAALGLALIFYAGLLCHVDGRNIDITCDARKDNQIDWDCIFGPDSLEEVHDRGGKFTSCAYKGSKHPCSRFIVAKDKERSEVKVQEGPEGFPFLKYERYVFKYSFRAVDGMKVATRFTHLGQIKGSKDGYMIKGDPIYSLTANKYGLMVRFSNLETIEDFHPGLDDYLKWEDATGEWVHVEITTVFGRSMEVEISGAVNGKAVWPSDLTPVAWHRDAQMARMKLGLYHSPNNVADGEVEYRDISIEGPNGIIRTSPKSSNDNNDDSNDDDDDDDAGSCSSNGTCGTIDITCDSLKDNQIDWECMFGPRALDEVDQRGGELTTCPKAKNSRHPCSMFIVDKDEERSEVKVKEGPEGFPFLKNEKYTFKYSFRAKEGMKVSKRSTYLGQLKGSKGGYMLSGYPVYALVATNDGLMVRFSNQESIDGFYSGFEKALNWKKATGQWVHVKIVTVFGKSMEVELSGAVEGVAVWPRNLEPVAWHRDSEMVRMKLGLYHSKDNVADGEVEYRDISIEGPSGIIRSSPISTRGVAGNLYRGCYEDDRSDRVLNKAHYLDAEMNTEMCAELCDGSDYFGTQYGTECWCGNSKSDINKHGRSDKCDMACPGKIHDRVENCGGRFAISVYEMEATPKGIPDDSKYLGCFGDHSRDRALSLSSTTHETGMSYASCKKFCDRVDAKFFGLQYGKQCFCGKNTDNYTQYGTASCSMECSGKSGSVCGGYRAMNVFKITG